MSVHVPSTELHPSLLGVRADMRGAHPEAWIREGGSCGKQGFPHGSEPNASVEREVWA